MAPRPLPPLDGWPVQLSDEHEQLFAWWCPPDVVVMQYLAPHFSLGTARAATAILDGVLKARRQELRRLGGLVAIHDLREMRSAELAAERHLDQAWKQWDGKDIREVWLVNDTMNRFARLLVHAVNLIARVTMGRPLRLVHTLDEPFRAHGVHVPGQTGTPLEVLR